MPKRKIDPATGEPQLTYREQQFINQYINNGGNASRAATSAGYSSACKDQSAYQVLRRPEVQRRICQRIAESRVTSDEIIGTLASFMRGTLADFLDESGDFSLDLAIQRGVDHQLKNITTTTREIKATKDKPAQVVRTTRASLHSPIQAARALAHILGIDRKGTSKTRNRFTEPRPDEPAPARENIQRDFDPLVWLDDLICDQMRTTGLPREQVIANLIELRPEIAKYVIDLEKVQTPNPYEHLTLRQLTKVLGKTIDLLASMPPDPSLESQGTDLNTTKGLDDSPASPVPAEIAAATVSPPAASEPPALAPDQNLIDDNEGCAGVPNPESSAQVPLPAEPSDNGFPGEVSAPAAAVPSMQPSEVPSDYSEFDDRFRFAFSKLSDRDGDALEHLRFRDVVQEWMNVCGTTEAQAIDAICAEARSQPFWFVCTIGVCVTEYKRMRSTGLIPGPIHQQQQIDAVDNLTPTPAIPPVEKSASTNVSDEEPDPSDSRLPTPDSKLPVPPAENSAFINVSAAGPDPSNSRLQTPDPGLSDSDSRLQSQDSRMSSDNPAP